MELEFWQTCLLVAAVMIFVDFSWARYSIYAARKQKFLASFWGAVIVLGSGFSITQYVHDNRLLIPAVIGAFVGTWIAIGTHKD